MITTLDWITYIWYALGAAILIYCAYTDIRTHKILNKVTYPQDARFAKNVLVIAPGLTVKSRLAVLEPAASDNYYEAFRIVPGSLLDRLRQGKVLIRNWHALAWDSEEQIKKRRSVDKRGAKSDEAYTREVLQEMAGARNLLVINDEAHHAWRLNPEAEGKYLRSRDLKDSADEATVWVGGLDRIRGRPGVRSQWHRLPAAGYHPQPGGPGRPGPGQGPQRTMSA